MPTNPELTAARDLVYQGVGRNVLQFQRLELLLKRLLAWHQSTYTAEAFEEDLTKRLEAQDKKTLGLLAGDLFTKVILKARPVGPADNAPPDLLSIRFGITTSEAATHEVWQAQLKALVEERNQLVHTSLLNWDLDTHEGCQAILTELDAQRERIRIGWENAKRCHEAFIQVLEQMNEDLTNGNMERFTVQDTET